jgi:hypothetical protein
VKRWALKVLATLNLTCFSRVPHVMRQRYRASTATVKALEVSLWRPVLRFKRNADGSIHPFTRSEIRDVPGTVDQMEVFKRARRLTALT